MLLVDGKLDRLNCNPNDHLSASNWSYVFGMAISNNDNNNNNNNNDNKNLLVFVPEKTKNIAIDDV